MPFSELVHTKGTKDNNLCGLCATFVLLVRNKNTPRKTLGGWDVAVGYCLAAAAALGAVGNVELDLGGIFQLILVQVGVDQRRADFGVQLGDFLGQGNGGNKDRSTTR